MEPRLSKKTTRVTPARVIIATFLLLIFIGTMLLRAPFSWHNGEISWWDAFFVSASAVSTTGLMSVPITAFSFWGKLVILCLAQLGGLGFLTLFIPVLGLFKNVRMRTHLITGQQFDLQQWSSNWVYSKKIVQFVTGFAFAVEAIGAVLLYYSLDVVPLDESRLFSAIFHSVSSFCNLGVSIFPQPFSVLGVHRLFILVTTILIALGSFGFVPIYEVFLHMRQRFFGLVPGKPRLRFSLQTKVIFLYMPLLTLALALFLLIAEWDALASYSFVDKLNVVLLNGFSFRSCGFSTFNFLQVSQVALFVTMVFCLLGSSPGSVGGGSGLKITTLALSLSSIKAIVLGKEHVEIFKRRIPKEQMLVTLAFLAIYLVWLVSTIFLVLVTESHTSEGLVSLIFESISAIANRGITIQSFVSLTRAGQLVLTVGMIIGRLNSLSLLIAIRQKRERVQFKYPEETFSMG